MQFLTVAAVATINRGPAIGADAHPWLTWLSFMIAASLVGALAYIWWVDSNENREPD